MAGQLGTRIPRRTQGPPVRARVKAEILGRHATTSIPVSVILHDETTEQAVVAVEVTSPPGAEVPSVTTVLLRRREPVGDAVGAIARRLTTSP